MSNTANNLTSAQTTNGQPSTGSDDSPLWDATQVVRSVADMPVAETSWGKLSWLVGENQMVGSEQTLGVVTIYPGKRNPLHAHPNCEELLYVLSGTCDHLLGDEHFELTPGSVIRIPRGVKHWARCTSDEPLVAIISFSAPDRRAISYEDDDVA